MSADTPSAAAVWQLNILKEFGGSQLQWMISESPLVDGAHVVVSPGGPGAGIVTLDKMTGKTVWTSQELSDTAGYSPITAGVQGVRTHMTFTAQAGVGVRASDGKLIFRYTKAANNVANIATPVFLNDRVFFTSGDGAGGGMLALSVKDGACGIFGWFSDARAVASRWNLTRRSASLANASGRIFRATSRPTDVS